MLYATIAERWVSGVFERVRDVRAYLQEMPENVRMKHVLLELQDLHYPVFVVEDCSGFQLVAAETALEEVTRRAPSASDDDRYVTLYRIDRDYRPRVAGEDEMGRLHHVHVDNQTPERVKRLVKLPFYS